MKMQQAKHVKHIFSSLVRSSAPPGMATRIGSVLLVLANGYFYNTGHTSAYLALLGGLAGISLGGLRAEETFPAAASLRSLSTQLNTLTSWCLNPLALNPWFREWQRANPDQTLSVGRWLQAMTPLPALSVGSIGGLGVFRGYQAAMGDEACYLLSVLDAANAVQTATVVWLGPSAIICLLDWLVRKRSRAVLPGIASRQPTGCGDRAGLFAHG